MKNHQPSNFLVHPTHEYQCENCGQSVLGGRYNNHCPNCLWSKHLDEQTPGDRASKCKGLMEPIAVLQKNGSWRIVQQCLECHKQFVVDSAPDDNFELIIQLSHNQVPENLD